MTSPDPDIEPLIDALRADLPEPKQAERMRARLLAAGIIAGGVVATPSAAAGATGVSALSGAGAQVGVVSKAAALFGGSKVLLAAAIVAGSSLPVTAYLAVSSPKEAPSVAIPSAREGQELEVVPPGATSAAPQTVATAEPPPATPERALPLPAATVVANGERSAGLPPVPLAAAPRAPRSVTQGEPRARVAGASTQPSVATFAALEGRPAESTLRAETELMDRALSALRLGSHANARSLLKQHAARFPNGALAPERERALERLNQAELVDARARER